MYLYNDCSSASLKRRGGTITFIMKILKEYSFALINPKLASTAVTVAIVVGSILFTINHGHALINGKMTRDHEEIRFAGRVAPRFARPRSARLCPIAG